MRNSKSKSEYEHGFDEDHRLLSKNGHHHRRKHKKHKYKEEEVDYLSYRNGSDGTPVRNEVIEIHDSSSEHGSQTDGKYYDDHNKKFESHRNKHHRKEERRHRIKSKRSRSNSRVRDKEVELSKIKCKKSRDDLKTRRCGSDSDSSYESPNDNRKRKYTEVNVDEIEETDQRKSGEERSRSEAEKKGKTQSECQGADVKKIKREQNEKQGNSKNQCESNSRRRGGHQEPSGSRGSTKKQENRSEEWGVAGGNKTGKSSTEVEKPNFGLSGKLAEDTNVYNGVVIKYSEPPEARMPKKRWRLYPFKGDEPLPPLYIHRQSAYLLGRDRKVVDMPIDHPSCSKQHAALQYRLVTYERPNGSIGKQIRLYIIDLESANGTFINNKKIEARKYVELFEKDVIKFGFSSREYVLLHEHSVDDNPDDT